MENRTAYFEDLLLKNGLKRTGPRLQVLNILESRDSATSQPFLENIVGKEVDRVTLYRILRVFEEKGIIHKVLDTQGTANYAICSHNCDEHQHHDEHVHFNCNSCNSVFCLDEIRIPKLKVPVGFKVETISLITTGICDKCGKLSEMKRPTQLKN